MKTIDKKTFRNQRGAAMFVVMITVAALLTAGLLTVHVGEAETKSIDYVASERRALFCAESGIADSRVIVGANYEMWDTLLDSDASNDPAWYPIRGYLDGDHHSAGDPFDYEVTIEDNDDESPSPNLPTTDNDLRVFIVARCLKYRNQSGQGASNTGNAN
jgi:hypothetical protein